MKENKFAPENPEKDEEIIEALTHDKLDEALWIPGMSTEKIKELRDAVIDRRSLEILGRLKPTPNLPSETTETVKAMSEREKEIINRIEELDEKKKKGTVTREDYIDLINEMNEVQNDPSNEIYTNAKKGSVYEVLYRTLADMHPELGITITDDAVDIEGKPMETLVAINVVPYETDKRLISDIAGNPIMSVLSMSAYHASYKEGLELEVKGILPIGTSKKALVRAYIDLINGAQSLGDDTSDLEEKIKQLDVEPLSDGELREIFEKIINDSFGE